MNLLSRSLTRCRTVTPGVLEVSDHVPRGLGDPVRGGVSGRVEDADATVDVLDDGEDIKGRAVQGCDGEDITGQDRVDLAAQERAQVGRSRSGAGRSCALGGSPRPWRVPP
jgi:hypothetical protein